MAIDYIIDMDCEVKRQLTKDGLVSMVKQKNRAAALIDVLAKGGKSREEALNHTFRLQLMTPRGIEEKEQKVSDLLESTRHLETLGAHCTNCVLRPNGLNEALSGGPTIEPFGCYRSINYPISRKAEEWLAGIAREALANGGASSITLNYIVDNKVTGREINALRGHQGRFLELEMPLEVVISKGLISKKAVNTGQIMFMLFGFPVVEPQQMLMLLYFVDALKISDQKPDGRSCQMAMSVKDDNVPEKWWSFSLKVHEGDDRSIIQLKEYFRSIFLACVLGKNITIDR
jgi:hypothetical protein